MEIEFENTTYELTGFGSDVPLLLVAAGLLSLVIVTVIIVLVAFRKKPGKLQREEPDLSIDVSGIVPESPNTEKPHLTVYGVPVKVINVVFAAAGRAGQMPSVGEIPPMIETAIPGFAKVASEQMPHVRLWPNQLSSQGFAHSFFQNVQLPGDHGKGTPWNSVAGKFQYGDQTYLVGLLCSTEDPNGLGELAVQRADQWLDAVRVRM